MDKKARIEITLLKNGIESLLDNHGAIEKERKGPDTHLRRYRCANGEPLGHEHDHKTLQNIWARRDALNMARLKDMAITKEIRREEIAAAEKMPGNKKGANSNLFGGDFFPKEDLVRISVRDLWEAAQIIQEVAGKR